MLSYYLVGLINYGLKALKSAGLSVNPDDVFPEPVSTDYAALACMIEGGVEVFAGREVNDRRIAAGTVSPLGGSEPRNRLLLVSALRL